MSPSDIAAWWGAVVATAVFGWDIYKWRYAGPKIEVSASPNMMQLIGDGSPADGPYLVIEARNNGDRKTTITHVVMFWHTRSRVLRPSNKPTKSFIVPRQDPTPLPYILEPGERWMTMAKQDAEVESMGQSGALFAGVFHSGSKKPVLVRLFIKPLTPAQLGAPADVSASAALWQKRG